MPISRTLPSTAPTAVGARRRTDARLTGANESAGTSSTAAAGWTDAAGPGCDEAKIDAPPKKAR